jgi:hypothetical protein
MFNPFNLGHALPLRFRRFSCCTRLRAIQRVSKTMCCIRGLLARGSRCEMKWQQCRFTDRGASPISVLRRMLRSRCQTCFAHHEGHHYPT